MTPEGKKADYTFSETRFETIRNFCKACKQEYHGGTYIGVDFTAPAHARVEFDNGKRYIVPPDALAKLTSYLTTVEIAEWERWGSKEAKLMSVFSDDIQKDGS
ncbi:hypothetical protein LCGC14_0678710 [marine sediment metagenome]|uniref:Uncharacterized protein n=1 Tax=marine sediment metagenome TaxID=412755 RepID=A0A0F9TA97_9ZZZZ